MKALRHAPAAPSRVAPASLRVRNASSGTRPPWSRQSSTARAIQASSAWSADSKPSTRIDSPPVAPAEVEASPGSSRRQFAGSSPDWLKLRTAATAAAKSAKRTLAFARRVGRSCRRIHASVMMPSVPSEPVKKRSGDGPAPEPGRRRVAMTPVGVTTRRPSTNSSMCV